ncbi:MAG TPA: AMP-binding protein [Roseiflexaceae bacterium]|nr:AMP-binding protein [Roseiflexaceae bacterium]
MQQPPASILHAFLGWQDRDPQRPCLRFGGQVFSYGQLGAEAALVAGGLRRLGLQRGDRLALFLDNSPRFLCCYLGAQLAGAVVVLVNTQYRQVELRHLLSDSEARLAVTDAARRAELARVQADLPALERVLLADAPSAGGDLGYGELVAGPPLEAPTLPAAGDLALIAYTSGTTGRSKGAMLSHGNLAANSAAVTAAWGWTADDRLLLTLPLFHIHGLGVGIHGTLLSGAQVDLHTRFEAATVFDLLLTDPPTMFFGVPTMYTRLIGEARHRSLRPPPIRLYVSGSAPLGPQIFVEFAGLFGQPILERYGMTETVMNTTNPLDGERRPGTVGRPFPGQEARVVDVASRAPLPDGEIGEIQVRGPHVCLGYWRRPDATAEVFGTDGWFSTGDLGRRSDDGYYTIVGRARELIISGGYNVYPREVEDVLAACPGVAEVAVFGAPDPEFGELVAAAVVRAPGSDLSAEQLVAFCRDQLAAYKKPRRVLFLDALPRNAMGKVQKQDLRERLEARG